MILYPIYIDPGTGSALFSIAIGIAATVFFLARTCIIKLKVFLFRRKQANELQHGIVIYAEDKRYWAFFELVLDEFELRKMEVLYLTSSLDDPIFSSPYKYVKGKYIGYGNKAFAYLNFLSASFVLTTTPELDVMQWKRSKYVKHYCHMIHGAGGSLLYRLFSLDYFDSILIPGEIEIQEIRLLEKIRGLPEKQLIVVGNSFFDRCSEKIKHIPVDDQHDFTVLVSPSWGSSALLYIYGEKLLDPLVETGWHIIVRPNPQSLIVEKPMLDKLNERYKENINIEWDYNYENIYSLSKSDVMISDFSGIIYDYVFMFDRPVLINIQDLDFRRLDAFTTKLEPYYYRTFREIGVELDRSSLKNIKDIISGLSKNTELQRKRQEAKELMWQYKGESGKRIVDFIVKTINKKGE